MAQMPIRKKAPTTPVTIWNFVSDVLVVCPRCKNTALVRPEANQANARLTCSGCGHSEIRTVDHYILGGAIDPYFHLPLVLQTSVSRHTLWAYNSSHLAFLRQFIEATDRRRPVRKPTDPLNKLLASRLPRWIFSAKNRDRLLAAIQRIGKKA